MFDRDLRRAEHVAGRVEGDGDAADRDSLSQPGGLRRAGKIVAIAQAHNVERLLRRHNVAMSGAGMVGVAMGDQRALDGPDRIDEEIAGRAIQAFRPGMEQVAGAQSINIGVCVGSGRQMVNGE